jgi:hypothetical protein
MDELDIRPCAERLAEHTAKRAIRRAKEAKACKAHDDKQLSYLEHWANHANEMGDRAEDRFCAQLSSPMKAEEVKAELETLGYFCLIQKGGQGCIIERVDGENIDMQIEVSRLHVSMVPFPEPKKMEEPAKPIDLPEKKE